MSDKPIEKREQSNPEFNGQAFPRLSDRLKDVADNHQYVGIGDTHTQPYGLALLKYGISSGALDCSNAKIGFEALDISYNPLLESYYKDEISDQTLETMFKNKPFQTAKIDGIEFNSSAIAQYYIDIIKEAKNQGCQAYGFGTLEGIVDLDRDIIIEALNNRGHAQLKIAEYLEYMGDDFDQFTPDQKTTILKSLMNEDLKQEPEETELHLINLGLVKPPESGLEITHEQFHKRLIADDFKAKMIRDIAGDGKMYFLYGGVHLIRKNDDIEHHLGPDQTATIIPFDSTASIGFNFATSQFRETMVTKYPDLELQNPFADYMLDIHNGRWLNGTTQTAHPIEVPNEIENAKPIIHTKDMAQEPATPAVQQSIIPPL